jgi:hypothetical protein
LPGHATRFLTASLLAVAFILGAISSAQAQDVEPEATGHAIVYKLEFEKSGDSINFDFFDSGYFVGPIDGSSVSGLGTFIFLSRSNDEKTFVVVPDSGLLYIAKKGTRVRMVIGGGNVAETGFSTYLAMGEVNTTMRVSGRKLRLALTLTGSAIAAADESDLEGTDNEPTDGTLGLAGQLKMDAKLQRGFTFTANADGGGDTTDTAVGLVTAQLEAFGYSNVDGSTTVPEDGTDGGTDGGTGVDGGTGGTGTGTGPDGGTGGTGTDTGTGTGGGTTGGDPFDVPTTDIPPGFRRIVI